MLCYFHLIFALLDGGFAFLKQFILHRLVYKAEAEHVFSLHCFKAGFISLLFGAIWTEHFYHSRYPPECN